jgi:hypothetical protein
MSRNASGVYALPAGNPVVDGTEIEASWANDTLSDIGNELTNSIDKGGRTTPTANLPLGNFKLTGLGAATTAGDAVRFEQANLVGTSTIASAATTNIFSDPSGTIILTGTTTITSFGTNTAGQIRFVKTTSALQLTYNATSLIVPGAANLALQAGDNVVVKGLGGSNAEVIAVQRASGVSTRLSDLGNASSVFSLSNGVNYGTWDWTGALAAGDIAFKLSSTIVTPGNGILFQLTGNAGTLLYALSTQASAAFLRMYSNGALTFNGGTTGAVNAQDVTLTAQSTGASFNGGNFSIAAGVTASGTGGTVSLLAGNVTSGQAGHIDLDAGSATAGGDGGDVNITSGAATLAAGLSGSINLVVGDATSTATPGAIRLIASKTAIVQDGSLPVVSSGGGAGATIRGHNNCFQVTFGTGSPTDVVVGFSATKSFTPYAVVTGSQAAQVLTAVPTTAGVTIASDTAFTAGTKVTCWVVEATV